MKHLVDYREWMLKELRDAGGWKMEMRDDAEALTTFITQVDAALSTPDAPPAFGPCTHCNTAPAVESNLEGTVRLCAGCTKLRANEAWSSQTGLPQEGENCERFQGKETAT